MNRMNKIFLRVALGVTVLCVGTVAAEAQSPSGSIALETSMMSSGMETMWLGCQILFQGKQQACSVSGLSLPATSGAARVHGTVFDLKDISAFAGTYTATGNPETLGNGHLTVKNQNGVTLILTAFGEMVELKVADAGMELKLRE